MLRARAFVWIWVGFCFFLLLSRLTVKSVLEKTAAGVQRPEAAAHAAIHNLGGCRFNSCE